MKTLNPKSICFVVLSVLSLSACQSDNGASPERISAPAPVVVAAEEIQIPAQSKEFVLKMSRNEGYNSYSVRVSTDLSPDQYEVYRATDSHSEGTLVKAFESSQDIFPERADENTFQERAVYYYIYADGQLLHSEKFTVKADLVVVGKSYAKSFLPNRTYNLASLVLKDRAQLYLNNLDITLNIDRLESENAEILSFDSGTDHKDTSNGYDGLSAGEVKLNILAARGNLKLSLHGANGMKGATGIDNKTKGAKGENGLEERTEVVQDCTPSVFRGVGMETMFGGGCKRTIECASPATSGKVGVKGPQGYPGLRGGRSGKGGNASIFVASADMFFVEFNALEGIPGQGGDGGQGGPGGDGGNAGPAGKRCSWNAKPGDIGAEGLRGVSGPEGERGGNGKVCLLIESRNLNICAVEGAI